MNRGTNKSGLFDRPSLGIDCVYRSLGKPGIVVLGKSQEPMTRVDPLVRV